MSGGLYVHVRAPAGIWAIAVGGEAQHGAGRPYWQSCSLANSCAMAAGDESRMQISAITVIWFHEARYLG
jgi:hypothetical protein